MKESIIQPIIDDLKKVHEPKAPAPPKAPPKPAELDQDAGGGYNPDHTYPQT
jgi:hypothetical protein